MTGTRRWGVLALGIVLVVVLAACSGPTADAGKTKVPTDPDSVVAESVLVLPGEPTAPVQTVALTRHYDRGLSQSVYELVRLDGVSDAPMWRTPPLGDDAYAVPLVSDGSRVITAIENEVYAFDLATGQPLWEATLSDVYQPSCDHCFEIVGDHLIVRSYDGVIHGVDTATGAETWTHRLDEVSGGARVVGSRLLIIDGTYTEPTVDLVDPSTGETILPLSTGCNDGDSSVLGRPMDADAEILASSAEPDMAYFGYGLIPACWQKFNLADGSMMWDTVLPDDYLDGNVVSILDEPRLTFSTRNPSLVQLDTTTGAGALVETPDDTEFLPVDTEGPLLVGHSQTTRGTPKWSIVGLDVPSGQAVWSVPMGEAEPIDDGLSSGMLSFGEQGYALDVTGGFAEVLVINSADARLSTQRISLADGEASALTAVPIALSENSISLDIVTWNGSRAVLVVGDQLVVLDTATSSVVWSYGPTPD